jgi:hypothetical protein
MSTTALQQLQLLPEAWLAPWLPADAAACAEGLALDEQF